MNTSESLTPEQEHYARVMFKNRILESNGQSYQDLFVAVMTKRDSRFLPVKPQGSIGDQGNDGFIPEEGRYYQVYAPENPKDKDKIAQAAKKAFDDFEKLKKHWELDAEIVDYQFVYNDKYQGAFPTILHALTTLKETHGVTTAKLFLAKDLEREFMQLSTLDKHAVLRSVIPRAQYIDDIDFANLTEILQHLVDNQAAIPAGGLPTVPDYSEKIQFNDIVSAADLLRIGNFQNSEVDQFFDRHSDFTKTDIRNRLANSYKAARVAVDEATKADSHSGDLVFFRLLETIVPEAIRPVQDAAIVLIAYFFEKCDVFEDPSL